VVLEHAVGPAAAGGLAAVVVPVGRLGVVVGQARVDEGHPRSSSSR
jgi:hypothetical protein